MKKIQILVIDLGSQYTLVIGRTLRELGIRTAILSPERAARWLKFNKPKGIILSGGSASVYEEYAPVPPKGILKRQIPILGICYGMQWLVQELGGKIVSHIASKEYSHTQVTLNTKDRLFRGMTQKQVVWASHGDSAGKLPQGFRRIASSAENNTIAAISSPGQKRWGVQFHPEVVETPNGKEILKRFIFDICRCKEDWYPADIISSIEGELAKTCQDKKAIIGFSGGVDSSTLTTIASRVLAGNLLAVCIDTGALRKDEIDEIRANARAAGAKLKIVRAATRFQKTLGNTTHSEVKRRRFKKLYARILDEEAKRFGADFIIQGSLATDIIESGRIGEADLIKSHHNVDPRFRVMDLHPLRNLFKYEIRELARQMNLPESIAERQPFPGPGLFIRIIGAPAKPDKLAIVRWADALVKEIAVKHGLYHKISQLVVGLNCTRTVGIKGDARVYGYTVMIRGVKTADFMTATGYQFPSKVRREIISQVTKHPKVVHVAYYEANKPPATTEFE